MIDKLVTRGKIALRRFFKAFSFFFCGKLSWKRAVAPEMQSKKYKALQSRLQYRYKHNITLRKDNDTVYSGHSAGYAGTHLDIRKIWVYNHNILFKERRSMKQKNRERLGIGMKIGAGVLALIMILGVVIQGFMYLN